MIRYCSDASVLVKCAQNVGIKMNGKFKSHVANQWFDTKEALDLHLKYLHDPKKASNLEE